MPRQTTLIYLHTHTWLKRLWGSGFNHASFSYLTPKEQWNIHAYFQISKDLTQADLTHHRERISKKHPSLPHQAGKAAAHFDRLITHGPMAIPAYQRQLAQAQRRALRTATGRQKPRAISVQSEVRPDIDVRALVRLVMRADLRPRDPEEDDSASD